MKKQLRQMIVLLVILVLLIAAFFGLQAYKKIQEKNAEAEMFLDVSGDEILRFSYDYQGERYFFEKDGDTWRYLGDPNLELYQERIISMVNRLGSVEIKQAIENVTDMSQYGLGEGHREYSFETATDSYTIYVGDSNQMTKLCYVCRPGEDTVYVVSRQLIAGFERTPDALVMD